MDTREKLIELLGKSLIYDGTGREMRFTGGDVTPVIANGVTVQEQIRDHYWATEQAYKNGYKKGKANALQWIPVTERLPEVEGRYLCVVRIGRKSGAVYVQIMNGDRYGFSLGHIYNDDVTHWMHLPEPPKEGE